MEELQGVLAIVCLFVILPGMFLFFADRRRRDAVQSGRQDVAADSELLRIAERMERRIESLEKILDNEAPGWRKRNAE